MTDTHLGNICFPQSSFPMETYFKFKGSGHGIATRIEPHVELEGPLGNSKSFKIFYKKNKILIRYMVIFMKLTTHDMDFFKH